MASLSSLRLKSGDGDMGDIKDTMEVREEMEVVRDPIPFSSNVSSKWASPLSFAGLISSCCSTPPRSSKAATSPSSCSTTGTNQVVTLCKCFLSAALLINSYQIFRGFEVLE